MTCGPTTTAEQKAPATRNKRILRHSPNSGVSVTVRVHAHQDPLTPKIVDRVDEKSAATTVPETDGRTFLGVNVVILRRWWRRLLLLRWRRFRLCDVRELPIEIAEVLSTQASRA